MAVLDNTTTTEQVCEALDIAMVNNFEQDASRLTEILGIFKPTVVQAGHALYQCVVNGLADGTGRSAEGDEVPLVKATVARTAVGAVELTPYRRLTTAEAIQEAGLVNAIDRSDRSMLAQIKTSIVHNLVSAVRLDMGAVAAGVESGDANAGIYKSGTGMLYFSKFVNGESTRADTLQAALAKTDAYVSATLECYCDQSDNLVHIVNTFDLADYLGTAPVTTQTVFGMTYLESFLGVRNVFASAFAPRGYVSVTPAENIHVYGVDFSALGGAGLKYTVSDSGLIGVHHDANYARVGAETNVLVGMKTHVEQLCYICTTRIGKELSSLTVDEIKAVAKQYNHTLTATTKDAMVTELNSYGIY